MILYFGLHILLPDSCPSAISIAANAFEKDLARVLRSEKRGGHQQLEIVLEAGNPESWCIQTTDSGARIIAADPLGAVYGLYSMSRYGLGLDPWTAWYELQPPQRDGLDLAQIPRQSKPSCFQYRGWFINDEVLLRAWTSRQSDEDAAWRLAFETLLRLGGNLIIPGTSNLAPRNWALAHSYGLIVTHHHHEPLGAKLIKTGSGKFNPSFRFDDHQAELEQYWTESIERQKGTQTLYALGFRGMGDYPFWHDDIHYETDEERGAMISRQIRRQHELVRREDPEARFCFNLYGEAVPLYRKNLVELPDDCIRIWADNGYGAQRTRQQEDEGSCGEVALPAASAPGAHGVYTHVTFNDTRGANHLLPWTQGVDWVLRQCHTIQSAGSDTLCIVNCGNIRPHLLHLDFWAECWKGEANLSPEQFLKDLSARICGDLPDAIHAAEVLSACWETYAASGAYWQDGDDSATLGDQFYHKPLRIFLEKAVREEWDPVLELGWLGPAKTLCDQAELYGKRLASAIPSWNKAVTQMDERCKKLCPESRQRIDQVILGSAQVHEQACRSGSLVCQGLLAYQENKFAGAWLALVQAKAECDLQLEALEQMEGDGCWRGFYEADAQTNVLASREILSALAGMIRLQHAGPKMHINWTKAYNLHREDHWLAACSRLGVREQDLRVRLEKYLPDDQRAPTW